MTREKIRNSIVSGISVLAIVLVAIASVLLQHRSEQWATHSIVVKVQVLEAYNLVQAAESSLRGYLLTHDAKYLEPIESLDGEIHERLLKLKQNISDNPKQVALVLRLQAHSEAKVEVMQKTLGLFEQGQQEAAMDLVKTNAGKSLMGKIKDLSDDIIREEDLLLAQRQRHSLLLQRLSLGLLALATLAAIYSLFRLYQRIGPLIANLDLANANLRNTVAEKNKEIALRKEAEQHNERLIGMLTSKNEELNHFAYIASHDLQEPLRTVNNFIEVFKEDYEDKLDDDAQQYFGFITGATQRMKALIEGLLDYSRLGKSRGAALVDMNELATAAKANLAAAISARSATVTVGDLPKLHCMRTEMLQLLQNLINNAIKYTAPGTAPVITLRTVERKNDWEFCVTDNGIGIAKAQQAKIFNMFSRLHGDGEYQGQGIGLAFCKKIVELHGGKIWVESEPGKGSSFYFTISKKLRDESETEQDTAH